MFNKVKGNILYLKKQVSIFCFLIIAFGSLVHAQNYSGQSFRIITACDTNTKVLAVSGASSADTAAIVIETRSDTKLSQIFKVESLSGAYLITSKSSGKVFDIANASSANKALLQQYTLHGGGNQLFRILSTADGFIRFQNVSSGLFINLANAITTDGNPVEQYQDSPSCAEKFKLSAVAEPAPITTWTFCANENQKCTFSGTRNVRYGANRIFNTKIFSGSVACTNAIFGDPVLGQVKTCQYSSRAVSTPAPAPVAVRDALKQPFATTSIWNMPIGSGAVYVPANLPTTPNNDPWAPMPMIDDEHIVLTPSAPLTNIYYSSAGWTGANRCASTGGILTQVPIPSDYIQPNNNANSSSVFLLADKRTLIQTQPMARCNAGGYATSLVKFDPVDLFGDGILGSHGGSGMSAIGGSIRVGELRPGQQGIRHAIKLIVYARQSLYACKTFSDCYRWPAVTADGYAVGFYGAENSSASSAMKMGALLAIPAWVNIAKIGLESEPGRQLAWTLQNYGSYIVDDGYGAQFGFAAEEGPAGSLRNQFKADYGMNLEARVNDNTPWVRDVQRLVKALYVVDNNSATTIGGGGTPRQSLAPPIGL